LEFAAEELELERSIKQQMLSEKQLELERDAMNRIRLEDSKLTRVWQRQKPWGDSK
jgi:hypothetical protein